MAYAHCHRFTRILVTITFFLFGACSAISAESFKPYKQDRLNYIYNLLFCDDVSLLIGRDRKAPQGYFVDLLAANPDSFALRRIAENKAIEGRSRALAYNRLRSLGEAVPTKQLLVVIVEMPDENGLYTLAAFSEGGARYIDEHENIAVIEPNGAPIEATVKSVISNAQPLLDGLTPSTRSRRGPPGAGSTRITLIASNGAYVTDVSNDKLESEPSIRPLMEQVEHVMAFAMALIANGKLMQENPPGK